MDIDEDEVTREPFFDNESDEDEDENHNNEHQVELETIDEVSQKDGSGADSCDDRSVSSICSEDVEFARSYDIQLQDSKTKAAALFESKFIDGSSKVGQPSDSPTGVTVRDEKLISTSVTTDCIHHRGVFLQTGDIVALCDQDDGKMYFAQLTGFLQDVYCEKSASVNWLVPIRPTSREIFNPVDYKIGLEDTQLRKLDSMIFIRHSPIDYYQTNGCRPPTSQPSVLDADLRHYQKRAQPYIWTTMRPCRAPRVEPSSRHPESDDANN